MSGGCARRRRPGPGPGVAGENLGPPGAQPWLRHNTPGGTDEIEGRPDARPPAEKTPAQRLLAWVRRRWLLILVLLIFVIFVILQLGNIRRFVETLVRGRIEWLAVAILLQVAYYSAYAVLYQVSFETVEVESQVLELVPVLFASIFLKVVVPSGGVSAVAVFVDDATRRGQSAARAAEGSLLVLVADLVTTVPLVALGLAFLQTQNALELYQIIVAVLFVLFAGAVGGVLLLGRLQPDRLRAVLTRVQATVNDLAARFRRPPLLPDDWAERNAAECIGAACNIAAHPRPLTRAFTVAFIAHLINVASLLAVALAYREPLPLGAVVAAFSLNVVFSVITIIPHGIGVAEGVMALVFISLGVATATSLVIAVAFRGLNLWIPLAIGFLLLYRVPAFGGVSWPSRQQGESESKR